MANSSSSSCLSGAVPVILSANNTCNPGFFCMNNTVERPPEFCAPTTECYITRLQMLHNICIQPQGAYEPIVCQAGFYCPDGGHEKIVCPRGYYCPLGSKQPFPCSAISACPQQSTREFPLLGFLCILLFDGLLLVLSKSPIVRRMFNRRARTKQTRSTDSDGDVEDGTSQCARKKNASNDVNGADGTDITQNDPEVSRFILTLATHSVACERHVEFSFKDLGFSIKGAPPILSGVTGEIKQGSLWGVMGPSGAATFVNVLLGKIKHTSGSIWINGIEGHMSSFKKMIGFVPQDDIILPDLTVRENILHSARVRLGASWTQAHIQEHVDGLISCLRLTNIQHSLVGDVAKRGISGGQRKRVNIALELAAAPKALILDEPTSGLDATAALSIVRLLKALCYQGVTVVCIIHQPRAEIFHALDKLLLLAGGRQVYLGDTSSCIKYFETKGFIFPLQSNPADILMDIISGHSLSCNRGLSSEPEKPVASLIQSWEQEQLKSTPLEGQTAASAQEQADILHQLAQCDKLRGASWCRQAYLCFLRGTKQQARQTTSFLLEISVSAVAGLLIGLSIYKIEGLLFQGTFLHPFELLSSATNYTLVPELGLLCSLAIGLAAAPPGVKIFGEEKLVYMRETQSGHSRSAYFIGKTLSTFFRLFLSSLHFTAFYMILATPVISFGMLLCINMLYFYCIYGLTSIVAVITRREDGPLVSMIVSLIIGVFGGYGPPLSTVKSWHLQWFWYMCPGTWLSEAYFNEHTAPFSYLYDVELAATTTGYVIGRTGLDIALLWVIGTVYRGIAYLVLVVSD